MRTILELEELLLKTKREYESLFGEPWPEHEMNTLVTEILRRRRQEFLASRPIGHLPQDDLVAMGKMMNVSALQAIVGFPKVEINGREVILPTREPEPMREPEPEREPEPPKKETSKANSRKGRPYNRA